MAEQTIDRPRSSSYQGYLHSESDDETYENEAQSLGVANRSPRARHWSHRPSVRAPISNGHLEVPGMDKERALTFSASALQQALLPQSKFGDHSQQNHNHHPSSKAVLMRIVIFHSTSGVCLFDHVYEWENQATPSDICKLVKSFYQIANDIGEQKSASCQVLFEVPRFFNSRRNPRARSKGKINIIQQIRLISKRYNIFGTHITVAAFHRLSENEIVKQNVQSLIKDIAKSFEEMFGKKLSSMRGMFKELSENENTQGLQVHQQMILQTFSSFLSCASLLKFKHNLDV